MHKVFYNQGAQTLRLVPMDPHGRPILPTAPTYSIEDLAYDDASSDRVVGSGTATQQGASTTTTAAVGPTQADDAAIAVASVSSFVEGHRYIVSSGEKREAFRLRGISGTTLYADGGLREDYATSATVADVEWECSFPSATAADEDNIGRDYQVKWVFAHSGHTYVIGQSIELVRYGVDTLIGEVDVFDIDHTLRERCRGNDPRVASGIKHALKHYEARVRIASRDPSEFRGSPVMQLAVAHKAAAAVLRTFRHEADDALAEHHESESDKLTDSELRGQPTQGAIEVDAGNDQSRKPTYGSDIMRLS